MCITTTYTHTTRTKQVRGTYQVRVQTPAIAAQQTITLSGTSLAGSYTLCKSPGVCTAAIAYGTPAATAAAVSAALSTLYGAAVTATPCAGPATCTWTVDFAASLGKVSALLPGDLSLLGGAGADVSTDVIVNGASLTDVAGSPQDLQVAPAVESAAVSTAWGAGLYSGTAGSVSTFTIQAKDSFGNDRCVCNAILQY